MPWLWGCPTGVHACPTGVHACPRGFSACPRGFWACPRGIQACATVFLDVGIVMDDEGCFHLVVRSLLLWLFSSMLVLVPNLDLENALPFPLWDEEMDAYTQDELLLGLWSWPRCPSADFFAMLALGRILETGLNVKCGTWLFIFWKVSISLTP